MKCLSCGERSTHRLNNNICKKCSLDGMEFLTNEWIKHPSKELMKLAIELAEAAGRGSDYPIGALMYNTKTGMVITGLNEVKHTGDSTRHAEIEVIRKTTTVTGQRYLEEWVLYTTHEPCPMCTAAAVWAKVGMIVFALGIDDMRKFTDESNYYKWRVIEMSAIEVIDKSPHKMPIATHFMNKKAQHLLKFKYEKQK